MHKKRKIRLLILSVAAAALAALVAWIAWGNTALELNTCTVTSDRLPEAFDGYRIVQISDLHNAEMGEDNEKLLALLREAAPDIIALTGDLIDSRNTDIQVALDFAEAAMAIAPCYYVTGNHETRISDYAALKSGLTERGVVVLEDAKLVLERAGQSITLIGVSDPAQEGTDAQASMRSRLQQLTEGTDGYTLLLSHRPELFSVYAACGIDLILSGHAHGGQVRLPLVGGLVAPNQGLFPHYDAGMYKTGTTTMIVSRGIGNSLFPFRVNNPPEVLLILLRSTGV